jgi:hypothetical protein
MIGSFYGGRVDQQPLNLWYNPAHNLSTIRLNKLTVHSRQFSEKTSRDWKAVNLPLAT